MAHKRIKWLDFAKGITILSVVMIHQFPAHSFFNYILDIFAMPVFFAISGYLYRPINSLHEFFLMAYKKVIGFSIPYIIFTLIMLLFNFNEGIKHYVFASVFHILILPIGYLWFLYALFFVFIIVGIFNLCHFNINIQIIFSLLLLIMQMFLPPIIRYQFNPIRGIFGYLSCFYLGQLMKQNHFNSFILIHKKFVNYFSLLWIIVVVIQIYLVGLDKDTDFFYYYDVISKLLSIPVFFSIFIVFPKNKVFYYFTKYGKYTLIIYLVHMPILSLFIFNSIRNNLNIINFPYHILLIAIIWYLCIFICHLSEHINLIKFVFYPRKFVDKIMMKSKFGQKLFKC